MTSTSILITMLVLSLLLSAAVVPVLLSLLLPLSLHASTSMQPVVCRVSEVLQQQHIVPCANKQHYTIIITSRCAAALQQGALQQAAEHAATARRAFDWVSCTATTAAAAAAACSASAAAAAADAPARAHSTTAATGIAAAAALASASTTGDSASLAGTITTHANSSAAGDAPECPTAANGHNDDNYSCEQLPPEQAPAARAALKRVLRLAAQGAVIKKTVTKKGVIRAGGASLGLTELRHRAESLLEEMEDVEDEIVQVRTSRTLVRKLSQIVLDGSFLKERSCFHTSTSSH
jgi:hypothetical protein